MGDLLTIFRFGWTYLRKYWPRLAFGIFLGILYGLTNGSFIFVSKLMADRLIPAQSSSAGPVLQTNASVTVDARAAALGDVAVSRPSPSGQVRELKGKVESRFRKWADRWLPRTGQAISREQIIGGLLFLPLLMLIRGSTDYFSNYMMGWVSERVINDLRMDVMSRLSSLSLSYFNVATSGDLLTRVNGDTATLHRCIRVGFGELTKESVTILSALVMLFLIDWRLTLFSLLLVPVCLIPLSILGKKARKASKASLSTNITQASMLVELISAIRVVKAYNMEGRLLERYRALSRDLVRYGMKGIQAKELVHPLIEVIATLGAGALLVFIFWSQKNVSDLVGFMAGLLLFYTAFKKLASMHILFEQTHAGIERLVQILRERPSVEEPVAPVPLKEFRQQIAFKDITFAYQEKPVLRRVSFSIPRGVKLGVAGSSGSGKSTLVNLLFRFYDPATGSVEIDGVDIRRVATTDLRNLLALVSQEIVVFDTTVAENIATGRPGATEEEIVEAARKAFAHDFIQQLPQGYQSRLGERGTFLSGGQRQRISIARAFVRNAPILVLDEATASLDSHAEAEVQGAIERLSENRTVLCVAHRLSTLRQCDRILVLQEGEVVEQGTFEELLQKKGNFAEMAERQGIVDFEGLKARDR